MRMVNLVIAFSLFLLGRIRTKNFAVWEAGMVRGEYMNQSFVAIGLFDNLIIQRMLGRNDARLGEKGGEDPGPSDAHSAEMLR